MHDHVMVMMLAVGGRYKRVARISLRGRISINLTMGTEGVEKPPKLSDVINGQGGVGK